MNKSIIFQAYSTPTLVITIQDQDGQAIDISGATRKDLIYRTPNGEEKRVAMSYVSDGVDGQLDYTFTVQQTKVEGDYMCQVDLAYDDWDGPSDEFSFTIRRNVISRGV